VKISVLPVRNKEGTKDIKNYLVGILMFRNTKRLYVLQK